MVGVVVLLAEENDVASGQRVDHLATVRGSRLTTFE